MLIYNISIYSTHFILDEFNHLKLQANILIKIFSEL